ncbi:unnamed protein product [Bursaphelenchus okinawaensis]|uniref:Cadherin domain-containing protein n=1 Tax=Bursaphelenchus okinawaensis TaxID=465554 RepID=A0A811L0Z6_9BILA|nr:unnamed protein product [Bursaphelenchus okinawaensis]CAG9114780.1 unnamed protein product [Bursaphelenchus okinawaensis]
MRWKPKTHGSTAILTFTYLLVLSSTNAENCVFPEQSATNFFFDVRADTPAQSILVDTVVEPPDAELKIYSVKSNNIKVDLSSKVELEHHKNGQFLVVAKEALSLPVYPSTINNTMLYITVECNGKPYPLITIRIKNFNTFAPEFLNAPYEVFVPNDALLGTEVETPIVAFDKDPSETYTVTYKIESHFSELDLYTSEDLIDLKTLPTQYAVKRYAKKQIPNKLKLKVLGALQKPVYYFNVTASDNQQPPRTAWNMFKVVVGDPREAIPHFTQPIYYGNFTRNRNSEFEIILTQPIIAIFPDRGLNLPNYEPRYELLSSEWTKYFKLDSNSARLYLSSPRHVQLPDTIELTIKAYLEADIGMAVSSKIVLTDASEVKLTYFSQCRYNVHLDENTPVNTKVTQFLVKGDIDGIDLLNGTETFEVSPDGVMTIKDNSVLDREQIERLIVMARLRSSTPLHPKSLELCQLATVDITIDDVNDHSPRFERNTYTFFIEENPFNNTEVGSIVAIDDDSGSYGKVKYRFLDDTLPFTLFQSDGVATLYYANKHGNAALEKSYSFTIEAYDSDIYPRTARVTIHVYLGEKAAEEVEVLQIGRSEENRDSEPKKDKTTFQFKSFRSATLNEKRFSTDKRTDKIEFGQENYTFNLTGRLDVGEYIGTIRLTEEKEQIDYELEDGIRGFVNLDSRYGTLRVGQKMIEDEYEQVRFAAMAKSRRGETLATTLVTVFIDEKSSEYVLNPLFEQAIYRFELEENQPEQSLAQIEAHHRSVELGKDKIWYTLDRTEDAKLFKIDPESGWLASRKPLDYEDKKTYNLKINGCLESNTKKCGRSEAIVVVKDLNDNEPIFEKLHYQVEIPSDLAINSEVVQVKATDKDAGQNAKLKYFINNESGQYASYFKIDEESGQVKLAKYLGPEITELSFYVSAKDSAEPPMMGRAQVQITVLNMGFSNVNAPEFDDFRYEVSFRAPIPAGSTIGRVKAVDKDAGLDGKVWYSLIEDHVSRKFVINSETGEIKASSPISISDGELIQLTVEAHDSAPKFPRKTPTIFMIHLIESEEPVQFMPMPKTVYISSSKPVGSTIFKVGLKSGDAKNMKFMVDQDPRHQLFGMIDDYLIVLLRLKQGVYKISIRAFNPNNNQSTVHSLKMVVMTDRDKYPVFEKLGYELKVATDAQFPVKLPAFPVSLRTGRVLYSLYSANGLDLPKGVKIDEITGELTVFEEFLLFMDRESTKNEAFLVVRAVNQQDPDFYSDVGVTLTLKRPVNELIFTSKLYRLIVREGAPVNTIINSVKIAVQQQHLHPKLRFTISNNDYFDINQNGQVILKKQVDLESLPQEQHGIIELTVTAQDGSQRSQTQVQIKVEDENEFAPKFEQPKYSFTVDSAVRAGSMIGEVFAYDKDFSDQNKVFYRAKIGSAVGLVDVRSDGKIFKNDIEPFEPGAHYNLIITASDSKGKQTETIVLFDVAEESSIISPLSQKTHIMHKSQSWSPEEVEDGTMIDAMPNGNWDFKIVEGNDDKSYDIKKMNRSSAKLAIMDRLPKKTKDHLLVEAVNLDDPFEKVETNVTIDLKALKPIQKLEFENQLDEVLLNAATAQQHSPIFRVKVRGGKHVHFRIVSDSEGLFKIDEEYGDVYIGHPIEQLENGEHEVVVTVTSGSQKISKKFTVIITVPGTVESTGGFGRPSTVTFGRPESSRVPSTAQPSSTAHNSRPSPNDHNKSTGTTNLINSTNPTSSLENSTPEPFEFSTMAKIDENLVESMEQEDSEDNTVANEGSTVTSDSKSTVEGNGKATVGLEGDGDGFEGRKAGSEGGIMTSEGQDAALEATKTSVNSRVSSGATKTASESQNPSTMKPISVETSMELTTDQLENGNSESLSRATVQPSESTTSSMSQNSEGLKKDSENMASEGRTTALKSGVGESKPKMTVTQSGIQFKKPKYKFEIINPKPNDVVGKLDIISDGPVKMNIIPEQFKQWFGVDPATSTIYMRDVPEELTGRQRAEFKVLAQDARNSKLRAEAGVKIDLVLGVDGGDAKDREESEEGVVDGSDKDGFKNEKPGLENGNDFVTNEEIDRKFETTKSQLSTIDFSIDAEATTVRSHSSSTKLDQNPKNTKVDPEGQKTTSDQDSGAHEVSNNEDFMGQDSFTNRGLGGQESSKNGDSRAQTSSKNENSETHKQLQSEEFGVESTTEVLFENTPDFSELTNIDVDKPMKHSTEKPSKSKPESNVHSDSEDKNSDINHGKAGSNVENANINHAQSKSLLFTNHKFTAMMPEGRYGNRGAVVNLRPASLKDSLSYIQNPVFEIESEEPSLPFYVRNETGDLIAFANIDREDISQYVFNVSVRDGDVNGGKSAAKDIAEVKITILDVNDNYPVWQNVPHVLALNANEPPTKIITVLTATDADEGSAGKVKYRITKNYNNLFDINAKGELSLTTRITALPPDDLEIEVTALDGGRPALRTPHLMRVEVFEDSDDPLFKKKEHTVNINKDARSGDYVYQVVAGLAPFVYRINDGASDLFQIDPTTGTVTLLRDPIAEDQNRYHILNITAINSNGISSSTVINVFMEGEPIVVTVPAVTVAPEPSKCKFSQKIYNVEIRENTEGKNKLTTVASDCQKQGREVMFTIHQANDVFTVDSKTGQVFVNGPLDREQKGMHFIVLNVTEITRPSRQTNNPVVDYAKKKLSEDQALVSVKVLDENDNEPVFANKNSKGELVAIIDWQAPLLLPVVRLVATDADDKNTLSYSLEHNDYFTVNESSGLVILTKSLANSNEDEYRLKATVDDGEHQVSSYLTIYKLAPGTNVLFLAVDKPESEVDEQQVAKKLSNLTGKDARVLLKQILIKEDGQAVLNKTHLFVYALDKTSKIPIDAVILKSLLDQSKEKLDDPDLKVMNVQLPIVASRLVFSWTDSIILAVCVVLLLVAVSVLIMCMRCYKHRSIHMTKTDLDYMVTAESPASSPHNVGLVTRKEAQEALARNPLPEAIEENTMSPSARSAMLASASVLVINNGTTTPSSTVTDVPPESAHSPHSSVL